MKTVVWIVVLFAAAVGLALASGIYTGDVYIVLGQTMLRINLHAFVLGSLIAVVVWYFLFKFIIGVFNIPEKMQRFGSARKGRKAALALNKAGLAYFEGRFEKAELEASRVLCNKEAGDNRTLALMLGAHAAGQMENIELRDRYLAEIAKLPEKQQLSRYLLLAESALNRRDYETVEANLHAAAKMNAGLTRLVRLQLRYAFERGDALEVLAKTEKLSKAGALGESETEQYQNWAYRRLLADADDAVSLKACLKRIPDSLKNGELSVSVAEKYERLGLYAEAVRWVKQHYPQSRRSELLEAFVESVRFLGERDQQKAIDLADAWLRDQPDNALLLMYLGQLAYGRKLWGKAKGYLEASIALKPSISARLVLAKVFDEIGEMQKAEAQRSLVLASVAEENRPSAETH
ncbi:TPA: heme biosynthesis protein HemY [Neisseria meningitidis]